MLPGHNTDIIHRGQTYHVQTEDNGREQALIETIVFEGGRILEAQRYSYKTLTNDGYDPAKIAKVMEQQHHEMVKAVRAGRFDAAQEELSPDGDGLTESEYDDQGLDSSSQTEDSDVLDLHFTKQPLFTAGRRHIFTLRARHKETEAPMQHVAITISLVSTFSKPQELWEGKTGHDGEASVECTIPPFTTGHAAIIIRASSEQGHDRLEQLVRKN